MNWIDTLKSLAPTVLSAALGPAGAGIVAAVGAIIGIDNPTQDKIAKAIQTGQLTPEQITDLKKLEMQLQADEAERGFKYAELEFKKDSLAVGDRADARKSNVAGGVQMPLFFLSLVLLVITLGCEIAVLFHGYPPGTPEMVVGRILGLMDAVAMMVLVYWYGSNKDSARKTEMLAQSVPAR